MLDNGLQYRFCTYWRTFYLNRRWLRWSLATVSRRRVEFSRIYRLCVSVASWLAWRIRSVYLACSRILWVDLSSVSPRCWRIFWPSWTLGLLCWTYCWRVYAQRWSCELCRTWRLVRLACHSYCRSSSRPTRSPWCPSHSDPAGSWFLRSPRRLAVPVLPSNGRSLFCRRTWSRRGRPRYGASLPDVCCTRQNHLQKQMISLTKSIPIGCVPPPCRPYTVVYQGSGYPLPRSMSGWGCSPSLDIPTPFWTYPPLNIPTHPPLDILTPRRDLVPEIPPERIWTWDIHPPHVDTCENTTFPQLRLWAVKTNLLLFPRQFSK